MIRDDFLGRVSAALGEKPGSTFRSNQEQDSLYHRKKTPLRGGESAHNVVDGAGDWGTSVGRSESDVEAQLAAAGITDAQVVYETGRGTNQGTGAHFHIEQVNPGKGKPAVQRIAIPASRVGAVTASAGQGGRGTEIIDPFSLGPVMESQYQGVVGATDVLGEALTSMVDTSRQVMEERKQLLTNTVQENEVLLDEQQSATQELRDRMKPLWARREAITKRLDDVNRMGLIERTFAGLFNKNYDDEYLEAQDELIKRQLGEIGDTFSQSTMTQEALSKIIGQRYQGQDSILQMAQSNATTLFELSKESLAVQTQRLQTSVLGLSANSELLRGQLMASEQTIGSISDEGELNTLIAQANKNGGEVGVNGVTLNVGQLRDRQRQVRAQNLEVERAELAMQAGRLSLQQASQEALVSTGMSQAERKAAIDAGGLFRGQRLPMDRLVSAYQADLAGAELRAGATVEEMRGRAFTDSWRNYAESATGVATRMQGVFGANTPPEVKQMIQQGNKTRQDMQAAILAAPEGAARTALAGKFTARIEQMQAELVKKVEKIIGGSTNNKDGQALIRSWVTNQPITPEQTSKGLVALLANGALPPGMNPNTPGASQVNAARAAMDKVYKKYGGQDNFNAMTVGRGGRKPSANADQLQAELTQAVTTAVNRDFINKGIRESVQSLPEWAKADGHSAGRINPQDLVNAQQLGSDGAYKAIASQVGITPEQAKIVFARNGINNEAWKKTGKSEAEYADWNNRLQVVTQQLTATFLDRSPSAAPGFIPSRAMADYMGRPNFQGRVAASESLYGRRGFAENIASNMTQGSLAAATHRFAQNFKLGIAAQAQEEARVNLSDSRQYRNDPFRRTAAVLSSVDLGLDAATETAVLQYIKQNLRLPGTDPRDLANHGGFGQIEGKRGNAGNAAIANFITNTKWESPALEAVRRKIAPVWTQNGRAIDSALARLEEGDN